MRDDVCGCFYGLPCYLEHPVTVEPLNRPTPPEDEGVTDF